MKFAYFGHPHLGGTHTVFRQLRQGLAPRGVEVRWMGLASKAEGVLTDPRWVEDLAHGEIVGPERRDEPREAAAMMNALSAGRYDGVFVNVLADQVQTNIARHLPAAMRRVMIVHNITPATYQAAASIRDHVHATVGVSMRCRSDLVRHFGFAPGRTFAIPHAAELAGGARPRSPRPPAGLRMLFVGRIEDLSKGVFWLPAMLDRLPKSVTLTVAGDGPDLPKLKRRLARFGRRVSMLGAVPASTVRDLLADHQVLIMPSRFEGCGLSLFEACAAGCVPVVSLIRGVTDSIVEHGRNGFLFPVGDWREAARQVRFLLDTPAVLDAASRSAMRTARHGFGLDLMCERYAAVLDQVMTAPAALAAPLPLEAWTLPSGMGGGLRAWLPESVKNVLRVMRERKVQLPPDLDDGLPRGLLARLGPAPTSL